MGLYGRTNASLLYQFFFKKLENGKRDSVEIDMAVCTMSIPINLSKLNKFKSNLTNLTYFNLTLT